jgi:N-acetylmuramoyl-L-alanine amidase
MREATLAQATAEAVPRAAPRPTPVAFELRTRPKIVLDPGHGGRDPGARGHVVEKDVTLAIARRLGALLRERLGAEVILTRTTDKTLPLPARTARANAEGADLFISIHANASPRRSLNGVETYYLNNTTDHATLRLASMENGKPVPRRRGKTDLRYILSSLVQVGKMEESVALASAVQRGLVSHLRSEYGAVNDLGVKRGPFYVLVGAHMPCVLVETAFLTHPREGRRLGGKAYREAIAEGLFQGVARFVKDSRRAQTL